MACAEHAQARRSRDTAYLRAVIASEPIDQGELGAQDPHISQGIVPINQCHPRQNSSPNPACCYDRVPEYHTRMLVAVLLDRFDA